MTATLGVRAAVGRKVVASEASDAPPATAQCDRPRRVTGELTAHSRSFMMLRQCGRAHTGPQQDRDSAFVAALGVDVAGAPLLGGGPDVPLLTGAHRRCSGRCWGRYNRSTTSQIRG